jgi:hypothetical protein
VDDLTKTAYRHRCERTLFSFFGTIKRVKLRTPPAPGPAAS